MFSSVTRRYDLLNRVLTLGLDERWRRLAAEECLEGHPARVLDLCCGTGDLALHLARRTSEDTRVVALDFSRPMLELARRKAAARSFEDRIEFIEADAAEMPFPDGHFDAIGIAFAFRNLTYHNPAMARYLAEISRVVREGGRFVIVETSQPRSSVLRSGFHAYLRVVAGPLGGLVSRHRGAYRYLSRSARMYYRPEEVTALLAGAGFRRVDFRPLMGGVAGIHVAIH
jgi:demethylmenaquinone methyltransferase/2-methoxy-6-polyprenyl-1,4-benzoquinol methylase